MTIVEILYVILGMSIVVITVTIVWLANETIKLVKSLRKSSDDVAFMTQEVKDKVLVVTEALDRAGTAATSIIGFIEDAIEGIKEKRDQLSDSIGLVAGVGDFFKKKKEKEKEKPEPIEKAEVKVEKETKTEKLEEKIVEPKEEKKTDKKEANIAETAEQEDLEHAKPIKKELIEKSK